MSPLDAPGDRGAGDPSLELPPPGGSVADVEIPDAGATVDPGPPGRLARLSSALRRPFGGSRRKAAVEAAASQEAVRQAFLAAESIVPATAQRRPPAEPGGPAVAVGDAAGSATGDATHETVALPLVLRGSGPRPAAAPAPPPSVVADAPEIVRVVVVAPAAGTPVAATTAVDARDANTDAPEAGTNAREADAAVRVAGLLDVDPPETDMTEADAPPAAEPGGPSWRAPGATAPADLLEVHESVTAAADDFFGGLVRRVERRP